MDKGMVVAFNEAYATEVTAEEKQLVSDVLAVWGKDVYKRQRETCPKQQNRKGFSITLREQNGSRFFARLLIFIFSVEKKKPAHEGRVGFVVVSILFLIGSDIGCGHTRRAAG